MLRSSTVSLNCITDANPDPHVYQFYLNDTKIGNSSSGVFNVTVEANGVYSCVPINTAGTGHNATVRITAVGKSVHFNMQDSYSAIYRPHHMQSVLVAVLSGLIP